ncbi:c-type cytochrome [Oceanisphaera pacifica]|uniref:Cytochrome c n=1 Tax=Oceanisphaera pacifica TaxID=2818389 RepID=A0ABS3NHV0_9GAMM|nr:cytochrome c [Oceanisphaera pacifica]MBO1520115.1 cytochrome c [Oceanisphaera pacifica]
MKRKVNKKQGWLWVLAVMAIVLLAVGANYFLQVDLSARTTQGKQAYNDNCASCHGVNLTGTGQGPSFIHPVYVPSHHSDASFYRAIANGVRAHHWRFGDMPPIAGVTKAEAEDIIAYIRQQQREGGIK